ncbi:MULTISPECIES: sensor histidine kinase [unclassified Microbacterium]|uniref:sensor histidine kinase n=1 Tax=unclassified Microbacterium TaxID=2609290 RepID=UPI000CFBB9CB|nr:MULTISPECIES: histidine kinase [unclassified Microbacterium]PQZ52868.1 ATP-binding protein [Microbacterium sp. MYb43]PQZ74604.1 ATP-binding protein [Microbacterium sp. MYb40]PRB19499.1 ATP-binding protein [Microbacterium sp. MYb54]PRB24794.1 ATP-binding protein [Microbacterium sp. MYb50]PRB63008.1 ATP-binding protein [Microbacterium sp. MYb24]
MSRTRSRSDSIREDEELRLPRAPGLFRRFWTRHPLFADILLTLICLLLSFTEAVPITASSLPEPTSVALNIAAGVVVAIGCSTLLWRRRAPLAPFVAAVVLGTAGLFSGTLAGLFLLLLACYGLAVYRSSRAAWTCFGIGSAWFLGLTTLLILTGSTMLQAGINTALGYVALGLIGTLVGVNVGGRKRYILAVIDRSRQLLIERDQQAQLAAASERARIAREMHDIVSHSLTVIVALSEGAAATPDREQARKASTSVADTARAALTEMRSMLGVLRDDETPLPLAPMQPVPPRDTVEAAQRAGYPATLTVIGRTDVSPAVAHAIGRIVQEGVTNAMRHASAKAITVHVEYTDTTVTIEIVNDGVTGEVGSDGFGVRGLSERALHVNGTVRSAPADGGRWVLRAVLPASGSAPATQAETMEDDG